MLFAKNSAYRSLVNIALTALSADTHCVSSLNTSEFKQISNYDNAQQTHSLIMRTGTSGVSPVAGRRRHRERELALSGVCHRRSSGRGMRQRGRAQCRRAEVVIVSCACFDRVWTTRVTPPP